MLEEYEVIQRCISGDKDSYAFLVERYQDMAYNIAYRMLGDEDAAKDMAQESFISAYGGLAGFRQTSKFSTWLCSILMNKCRDYIRGRKEHVPLDDAGELRDTIGKNPEQALDSKRRGECLQLALAELPEEFRDVIVLKHFQGLDYKEMEVILGANVNLLKVRTYRGREMLKKRLMEMGVLDA